MEAVPLRLAVVLAAAVTASPATTIAQPRMDGSPLSRSVGISTRMSVEAFVDPHRGDGSSYGFYGIQLNQRLVHARGGRAEVFATVASVGSYEQQSPWEMARSAAGTSRVYQVPSRTTVEAPLAPVLGGSLRASVAGRVTVRLHLQGLAWSSSSTIGTRLTAGVSILLGSATRVPQ